MDARWAREKVLAFGLQPSAFACAGFTMVEIAICLAIIGIALVAIIGVLPAGLNVQKDNREETLIGQDATVFIENIRNGARGLDDLTNYVLAITNYWAYYPTIGALPQPGVNSYTYTNFTIAPKYPTAGTPPGAPLTNGMNIIGLLSTPEYINQGNGAPILNLVEGGISNYVVVYVRSLSGPAVEKPPQDNDIIRSDSFSYKMICQNVPVAVYIPPIWQVATQYKAGDEVYWAGLTWRATAANTGKNPRQPSAPWVVLGSPAQQLTSNLRELRFTFLWPLLPNGAPGNGRQTFRTSVAGQMVQTGDYNNKEWLYFFQPQTFTSAP
ncbi:MAG TPA: prepilin-type N-terminal cleavage/methylation domain-containing protein [Candidatus Limnocylindrales bacterium]|nr:prepilin-type N-terminal cleavage/methylation domain-containing protein [Candidatus Limnocylindrales bacterium]